MTRIVVTEDKGMNDFSCLVIFKSLRLRKVYCCSFLGGDQGILNAFFSDWAIKDINKYLPFIYNLSVNSIYTYLPAFHKYVFDRMIRKHVFCYCKSKNIKHDEGYLKGIVQTDKNFKTFPLY